MCVDLYNVLTGTIEVLRYLKDKPKATSGLDLFSFGS